MLFPVDGREGHTANVVFKQDPQGAKRAQQMAIWAEYSRQKEQQMQRPWGRSLLAYLENSLEEVVGVRGRRVSEVIGGGSGWGRTLESLVRIWTFIFLIWEPRQDFEQASFYKITLASVLRIMGGRACLVW